MQNATFKNIHTNNLTIRYHTENSLSGQDWIYSSTCRKGAILKIIDYSRMITILLAQCRNLQTHT